MFSALCLKPDIPHDSDEIEKIGDDLDDDVEMKDKCGKKVLK